MQEFILVTLTDEGFISSGKKYKAKTIKKAAKKAYMNHKKLSKIYMYDPLNKKVHSFDTEGFKNKKKKIFY